jgi:enterochelin esterase-like enzyme
LFPAQLDHFSTRFSPTTTPSLVAMNKEIVSMSTLFCLLCTAVTCVGQSYTYAPNTTTTEVLPNGNITFRMSAPNANSVQLVFGVNSVQLVLGVNGGLTTFQNISMTKDSNGIWNVTVGPNIPRVYEYYFLVDGVEVIDPGNGLIKAHRSLSDSLIEVPGDPRYQTQNLPHGKVNTETYYSSVLNSVRNFIVYTPPGYSATSTTLYPVLFVYHGDNDKPETLVDDDRVPTMIDFMIANGQALPMVVAMVNLHALPPENFQSNNGDPFGYFTANLPYADKELMVDVIPFLKSRYRIRTDSKGMAISGFSAGGFEALESGVLHLGVFGSIGTLSPLPSSGLGSNFYNVLGNATLVNQTLKYFYLGIGDQDTETGGAVFALNAWLDLVGVNHRYDVVNGVHNNYTISLEFYDFVTMLFR